MGLLNLMGRISLDATGFQAGLRHVSNAASKAGDNIGRSLGAGLKGQVAGLLGVGTLIQLSRSTIEYADSLDEMAERLGITAEKAQLYSIAAKLGGSDSEFFAARFEKLRSAMADGKSLAVFGIQAETAEQAIDALAKKIQTTGLNTEQATAFVNLFGKGSGRLINILGDLDNAGKRTWLFGESGISSAKRVSDLMVKAGNNIKVAWSFLADPKYGALTNLLNAAGFDPFGVFGKDKVKTGLDEGGIVAKLEAEANAKTDAARRWMTMQDQILKLEKEIATTEEDNRQAGLTREERMNELLATRAKLQHDILFALTEEAGLQIRLAQAKNEQAIIRLNQQAVGGGSVSTRRNMHGDSLSSIGNFLGQSTNSKELKLLGDQVQELKAINSKLSKRQNTLEVPI